MNLNLTIYENDIAYQTPISIIIWLGSSTDKSSVFEHKGKLSSFHFSESNN